MEVSTAKVSPGIYSIIYPSHGYTALVEDEFCKKYQAILASYTAQGTYRCMKILYGPRDV